jgi:hypothetical protein
MTPDLLSSLAAISLSLAFSYLPGLSQWYQGQDPAWRRLVMLAALLGSSLTVIGVACSGWAGAFGLALTCDAPGAVAVLRALILALVANQATFLISPKKFSSTLTANADAVPEDAASENGGRL